MDPMGLVAMLQKTTAKRGDGRRQSVSMAWGTTQDPHGGANDGRAETRQYKSLQRVGPKNIPGLVSS